MIADSMETHQLSARERGEVPQFFYQGVTEMVTNRLPNYISQGDKELVIATHPDPRIHFQSNIEGKPKSLKIPDFVKQQDKYAYSIGIGVLNEMATESLVLKTLGEKRSMEIVASKFPGLANKFLDIFTSAMGTDETAEKLTQHIHVAYLTGKRADLDKYLQENYGFTGLDNLAVELGKAILRNPTIKIAKNNEDAGMVLGNMSLENPGKIYVNMDMLKTQIGIALMTVVAFGITGVGANAMSQAALPENKEILAIATLAGALSSVFGSFLT